MMPNSVIFQKVAIALILIHPLYWHYQQKNYTFISKVINPIIIAILYTQVFLGYMIFPIRYLPDILQLLGLTAIVVGVILGIWARNTLGDDWNDLAVTPHPEQKLVTHGPYQYTRNPIYLGGVLVAMGFELVMQSWLFILGIPMVIYFRNEYIAKEERDLEKKFGEEYLQYQQTTPRFL